MEHGNSEKKRKKSITKQNQENRNQQELIPVDKRVMNNANSSENSGDSMRMIKSEESTLPYGESYDVSMYSKIESSNPKRKKSKCKAKQDQDNENQQEAFIEEEQELYVAASNGSLKNLNQILDNWKHQISNEVLENRVLSVYSHLNLNNIPLTDEVELSLYNYFLKRCFFAKNPVTYYKMGDIKKHMKCLSDMVDTVNIFADEQEIFILTLKCLMKEIYVLKHLLRSTYDKLPWEEIEFFLICFIISATQQHDLNIFYRAILKKSDLIHYLKMFSSSVKQLQDGIFKVGEISELSKLPDLKRSDAIQKIIEHCTGFKALYKNFHCIRDVHSLYKISKYAKLVHSVHQQEKGANKVIIRGLYVIALHLKNTLISPKLSSITTDFILLTISENSRKVILDLMNSGTYREAFRYKTEILKNFNESNLQTIRDDVELIGDIANDLLFRHFIRLYREIYPQRVMQSKTELDKLENMFPLFLFADKVLQISKQNIPKHCIDKLIDNLKKLHSTIANNPLRVQLKCIIKNKLNPKKQELKMQQNPDYVVKPEVENVLLPYVSTKFNTHDVQELLSIVFSIQKDSKKKNSDNYEIEKLCAETINLLTLEVDTWNETITKTLTAYQEFLIDNNEKEAYSEIMNFNYQDHMSRSLQELRGILEKSSYKRLRTDKKSLEIFKSLLLDVIYNVKIVSDEEKKESDSNFCSMLIDYLEGDYEMNDLIFNSFAAIFQIAQKVIQEDPKNLILTPNSETKASKVQTSYHGYFFTMSKKQKMFSKVARGDAEIFSDGNANIRVRDTEKSTYLHRAVEMCDIRQIEYLCNQGLNLNYKNNKLQTPLHIATKIGNNEVVEYIVKKNKGVIHEVDTFGRTALHIAVLNEHIRIVEILLDAGSNPFEKDYLGFTSLFYSLLLVNTDLLKILLQSKKQAESIAELNEMQALFQSAIKENLAEEVKFLLSEHFVTLNSENGPPALFSAVSNSQVEMLEILLEYGANPNSFKDGKTALHTAVLNEQDQIIQLLIGAGSNPLEKDKSGESSITYVLSNGKKEILPLLLPRNKNLSDTVQLELQNSFHLAIKNNDVQVIEFLLSEKLVSLDVENQVKAMRSALFNNQIHVLETLLFHDADPNYSIDGRAPILIAAQKDLDLVKTLVDSKADVNKRNPKNGMTALHYAATEGNDAIIDFLLKHNATNSPDAANQTPLHLAVKNRKLSAVKVLLKSKPNNINALNSKGYTPLHIASEKGYIEIAQLLIQNWAELDNEDYSVSPLYLAKKNRHEKIAELLVGNGAMNTKPPQRNTTEN